MRRMISSSLVGAFFALAIGAAFTADAHVALLDPPARYDSNEYIKYYPCGHPDNPAAESTRSYVEGSTITVTWDEYVPHPGHYRIALSTEGDQALIDPTDYDDFYVAANVLADDIADPDGVYDHSFEITLPAGVTCEKCTLQLLQIMTDKMPWGPEGGNEIYYQCADITITPAAGTDSGVEESSGGDEVGDETSSEGGSSTGDGPDSTAGGSATTASDESSDSGGATLATTTVTSATGGEGDDDDDDGEGCGCRSSGGAIGWSASLLLLGLVRRRRACA